MIGGSIAPRPTRKPPERTQETDAAPCSSVDSLRPPPTSPGASSLVSTTPDRVALEQPETNQEDYVSELRVRFQTTLRVRELLLRQLQDDVAQQLLNTMLAWGVSPPKPSSASHLVNGQPKHLIDRSKQRALSELLRRSKLTLPDFVRLLRGETAADPRPNKALEVPIHLPAWSSYEHKDRWDAIVCHGVVPTWNRVPSRQDAPPQNHASAR